MADDDQGSGDFLLSEDSVILCAHGGLVQHVALTSTSYRIAGRRPMLMNDSYIVAGCPFAVDTSSPCQAVSWVTASTLLFVKGQPVLTRSSSGICTGFYGAQGTAIVGHCQLNVREPDSPTFIVE